ncbi:hypothetical protein WG66_008244 [Moniliophthora roreri]|nr:hypothetical protein WG66_008244 [Moniliophthora roreri]
MSSISALHVPCDPSAGDKVSFNGEFPKQSAVQILYDDESHHVVNSPHQLASRFLEPRPRKNAQEAENAKRTQEDALRNMMHTKSYTPGTNAQNPPTPTPTPSSTLGRIKARIRNLFE